MTATARYLKKAAIAHLLRAAAGVSGRDTFVIVGTGAVIAQLKSVPLDLMETREIDIYVPDDPDAEGISDLIDGTIGEGSPFDDTFGYYAHGIGERTACLPDDWAARAVRRSRRSGGGSPFFVQPQYRRVADATLSAATRRHRLEAMERRMSDLYTLDPQTEAAVKAGVASGRYESPAVLLKQAVNLLADRDRRQQALDLALDKGIADIEAGRVIDADEVFDELEARYASPEAFAARS